MDHHSQTTVRRILIGASTGAMPTLEALLMPLRPPCPAIVVVQHMPRHYLARLAARLQGLLRIPVQLVDAPRSLEPSTLYLAPGDGCHVALQRREGGDALTLPVAAAEDLNVPSIDTLFQSGAALPDADGTLAILLSGMGRDGAAGMRSLRVAGGECWVEDPETARVPSMPKAAIEQGAAPRILRGPALGPALCQRLAQTTLGAVV